MFNKSQTLQYLLLTLIFLLQLLAGNAQLTNNGGTITIAAGAQLICKGDINNSAGTILNSGSLTFNGNLNNAGLFVSANTSSLEFSGSAMQVVNGNPVSSGNTIVNNKGGIFLNTDLLLNGSLSFVNGVINNPASLLIFGNGSSISTSASDLSHVNGRVKYEGTGIFTFPVGNAFKYQPIQVNLFTNTSGLTASYAAANAGNAVYSTAGSESTPLTSYNGFEHWQVDLSNATGNADGTLTVFWEGFRDGFSTSVTDRRVARKSGNTWLNEGGVLSGNLTSGSVTSNTLNTWGVFALGSVNNPLPLNWISFSGSLNQSGQPQLTWKVVENNVMNYEIQKSNDARNFGRLAEVGSKGNGQNSYSLTESTVLRSTTYYRVMQKSIDGTTSFSGIIRINSDNINSLQASVIQPTSGSVLNMRVRSGAEQSVRVHITNSVGQLLSSTTNLIYKGDNIIAIPVQHLAVGIYHIVLFDANGKTIATSFLRQ